MVITRPSASGLHIFARLMHARERVSVHIRECRGAEKARDWGGNKMLGVYKGGAHD